MIFKENSTSVSELILPPITQTKIETSTNSKPQEEKSEKETKEESKEPVVIKNIDNNSENPQPTNDSQNINQKNEEIEVNKKENNRYKIPLNKTIPEENLENSKDISEEIKKTQEKAKTVPNMKALTNNDNTYIDQVILENVRSL